MRLLHTMLRVGSLQRSIDFYTRVMGMTLLRTTERPGASSEAAISFRAEFFAPPTCTVPESGRVSGPSETTRKLPMQ